MRSPPSYQESLKKVNHLLSGANCDPLESSFEFSNDSASLKAPKNGTNIKNGNDFIDKVQTSNNSQYYNRFQHQQPSPPQYQIPVNHIINNNNVINQRQQQIPIDTKINTDSSFYSNGLSPLKHHLQQKQFSPARHTSSPVYSNIYANTNKLQQNNKSTNEMNRSSTASPKPVSNSRAQLIMNSSRPIAPSHLNSLSLADVTFQSNLNSKTINDFDIKVEPQKMITPHQAVKSSSVPPNYRQIKSSSNVIGKNSAFFTTEIEKELSNLTLSIEREMEKQEQFQMKQKQFQNYEFLNGNNNELEIKEENEENDVEEEEEKEDEEKFNQRPNNNSYGPCANCNKEVIGQNDACQAMNK
jgi:hypothetical protein